MARTLEEIEARCLKTAPRFMRDDTIGQILLKGLAGALFLAEELVDFFVKNATRRTADNPWLGEHGKNIGLEQEPWETDEEFRERCYLAPRGPTPDFVTEELNRLVQPDGYEIYTGEPTIQYCDLEDVHHGVWCDLDTCLITTDEHTPLFWFSVLAPIIEVPCVGTWFCDVDELDDDRAAIADDVRDASFMDPLVDDLERQPYDRIRETLELYQANGTRITMIVKELFQLAHLPNIWRTTGGHFFS